MLCEKTGLKIPIKAQEFGMNENNSFLIKTQVWGGGVIEGELLIEDKQKYLRL